jgi:ABC-type transport system substrate-binding protein
MKFKFRNTAPKYKVTTEGLKKPFLHIALFFKNIKKSYSLMPKFERVIAAILMIAALLLLLFKFYQTYIAETNIVPADNGEYTEAVVGEVKYLSPVFAQTDAEKSASKLIFTGLIKIVDKDTVAPDLAESWQVSEDGKRYTFKLRPDAVFSDGNPVTADDIAYTISLIKAPESKSPLQTSWSNVGVIAVDQSTVELDLPNAYGPFIYNCNFGIVPAHLSADEFSKKLIGSGPFKFVKTAQVSGKIKQIDLARNDSYYGVKPHFATFQVKLFLQKEDAVKDYEENGATNALFGADSSVGKKLSYESSKRLGLVFNLRNDKLKDKDTRLKLLNGTSFDAPTQFTLTTLDSAVQRQKAEELKTKLATQKVQLDILYLNPSKLQDALQARNYELLLYGFDFGLDRDPYTFWHSSQIDALNFAGWSDKASDILLEDARMLTDETQRNAKYDQFYQTIAAQGLAEFYEPIQYSFYVKDSVKNVSSITGTQVYSRYQNIADWYTKEKRVRGE